jgi:thiosulfate dehydrogenase (quinone) large subunit
MSRGGNMSIESQLIEALRGSATVFLRLALGVAFLSAVADRFGLWGPAGAKNVAWGDFAHFTQYAGQLNPWAPAALIPTLAWVSTGAELVLGVALILGLCTRWAALLSGILLLLFAGGMSIGTGLKSALDASVFSAAAAAFALVVLGAGPWSVDSWRGG